MATSAPSEIGAPAVAPPRLAPSWPLPPYRYVPGLNPHPFRHPAGHLYTGGGAPAEAPWDPATPWREDRRWLYGLDLLNQRYPWEAHEVWEALWHHAPRDSASSALLQGLIQLAAALLKRHLGEARAAERLLARAEHHLLRAEALAGPAQRGLWLPGVRAALAAPGWPVILPEPR